MNTRSGQSRRRARASELDSLASVLGLVRSGRAARDRRSRVISGLGRAVVSDRVTTLLDLGLITEEGLGPSTGGRAPRQMRFKTDAGYVLVSSLGTTTLGVGLAYLSGHLLIEHHEPADTTLRPEKAISRIMELFDWMLEEHPAAREPWAISLALPGLVGPGGGRLGSRPTVRHMPDWGGYPIYDELGDRYRPRC